jgi:hypothetical protein
LAMMRNPASAKQANAAAINASRIIRWKDATRICDTSAALTKKKRHGSHRSPGDGVIGRSVLQNSQPFRPVNLPELRRPEIDDYHGADA